MILIAGLIIFAHAVIPHHHHFDSREAFSENLECETTNTESHNDNPDAHCHAFNLIISEKGNDLTTRSATASNFNSDLFYIITDFDFASKLNEVNHTHCFTHPTHKQIFLTNISLRGPPATV